MSSYSHLLPYLILLPLDSKSKQDFIRTILAPKVAAPILSSFDKDGRVLQRDLVEKLPHSNKSILSYLSSLNKAGLITSGSTIHQGKRVVKHELTKTGWSLARIFFEGLPSDVHELTSYLLEDYLTHIVSLFSELDISSSTILDTFTKAQTNVLLSGSKSYEKPEFLIFGASAYYTRIQCSNLPSPNNSTSCETPTRFPGGPSINLAMYLAGIGHSVSFVSTVGNDQEGWNVISALIQKDVDVADISIEDGLSTNETVLIDDQNGSRSLIGISSEVALSITSPSQVPWSKFQNTKAVYLGEVFVEVASTISAFATTNDIPIVYGCSVPFLERGLKYLDPILKQVDILILSNQAWSYLKKTIRKDIIDSIRAHTKALIIVRDTPSSYSIYDSDKPPITRSTKSRELEISASLKAELLIGLSNGLKPIDCVTNAIDMET